MRRSPVASMPQPSATSALPVPTAASDSRPTRPWLPLAALVLLAALLRFATLATQSLWFDEAATWELTRLPFGDMLSALPQRESNPPLFYFLEWLVTRAFGDGEFSLRALSALAGTLLVPVAFGIGRRIGGTRAGLATAALVAVNPLLVWFSQEARSYELVALLSAASLLLFLRALDDDRPRVLASWALLSALALCTHYFACFVLAPQIGWLLWRHPRRRAVLVAVAALALVALGLLPMLLAQRGNPYDIAAESMAVRLLQIPKQFLLGYHGPAALPSGVLGAALIATGIWLLVRHGERAIRDRALLVAVIGLIGIALPAAGAVVGADYVNARNLIPALVPLAATLGTGFAAVPRWGTRLSAAPAVLLCVLSAAILATVATDPEYQRPDWKGLAGAVGSSDDPRAIVVSPANGETALRYYRHSLVPLADAGMPLREVDVVGIAGSGGPGDSPEVPAQVGTQFSVGGFGEPKRQQTDSYVILRFRAAQDVLAQPATLAPVRFSPLPPSVDVLPAGR